MPVNSNSKVIMSSKYAPSSNTTHVTKERKPFTFNNYIMNQSDVSTGSYKGNPNNDSALVGFLNQSNGSAIDIRINSNKEGIHDY